MEDYHSSFPLPFSPPSPLPLLCGSDVWATPSHGKMVEDNKQEVMSIMEELRQALLYATVELESTRAVAQEQLMRMEAEVASIRALLHATVRERDEARQQCHQAMALVHATTHLQHHNKLWDENGTSTSSEESSIVSSPPLPQLPPPRPGEAELDDLRCVQLASKRELPEKGRLLEAVMKAGPLLQNLLLAGPLPQWRHPPPPLRGLEIPPAPVGTTNLTTPTTSSSWSPNTSIHLTNQEI